VGELAELTKNYSGAEIAGVVKAASSYAFSRHIKVGTVAGVAPDVENMKVNMSDFLSALEEVPPAFGVSEAELQQLVQNGIIPFARHVDVSHSPYESLTVDVNTFYLCIANLEGWSVIRGSNSSI
jgi:vesicle-fusing ATPase